MVYAQIHALQPLGLSHCQVVLGLLSLSSMYLDINHPMVDSIVKIPHYPSMPNLLVCIISPVQSGILIEQFIFEHEEDVDVQSVFT